MGKRGPRPGLDMDEICRVATDLIGERGLEPFSLSALASRLKTSPSALYRYFESKEALLVLLQERAIDDYRGHVEGTLDEAERRRGRGLMELKASRLARVIRAFAAYIDHRDVAPAAHRLLDSFLSAPSPVLSEAQARAIGARVDALVDLYVGLLDDAVAVEALHRGDNRRRAHLIWAALHGLDHFRKRDRIQPEPLQVGSMLPDLFSAMLRGFGASPGALQSALTSVLPPPE